MPSPVDRAQSVSSCAAPSEDASARVASRSARKTDSRSARAASSAMRAETDIPRRRAWAANRSRVCTDTLTVVDDVVISVDYPSTLHWRGGRKPDEAKPSGHMINVQRGAHGQHGEPSQGARRSVTASVAR